MSYAVWGDFIRDVDRYKEWANDLHKDLMKIHEDDLWVPKLCLGFLLFVRVDKGCGVDWSQFPETLAEGGALRGYAKFNYIVDISPKAC